MKRKIKAILAVVLIAILMVSFSSGELYAKDCFVQNDYEIDEEENNLRGNMDCFEIKRKLDGNLDFDECRVDNEVSCSKQRRIISKRKEEMS